MLYYQNERPSSPSYATSVENQKPKLAEAIDCVERARSCEGPRHVRQGLGAKARRWRVATGLQGSSATRLKSLLFGGATSLLPNGLMAYDYMNYCIVAYDCTSRISMINSIPSGAGIEVSTTDSSSLFAIAAAELVFCLPQFVHDFRRSTTCLYILELNIENLLAVLMHIGNARNDLKQQ